MDEYSDSYLKSFGLAEYLESVQGETLSLAATNELAHAYMKYADRTPSEIASVLAGAMRYYNLEVPLIEGILTPAFWEAVAVEAGWVESQAPETAQDDPALIPAADWQTRQRGSNDNEYQIYRDCAEDLGWPVKSYEQWLAS